MDGWMGQSFAGMRCTPHQVPCTYPAKPMAHNEIRDSRTSERLKP